VGIVWLTDGLLQAMLAPSESIAAHALLLLLHCAAVLRAGGTTRTRPMRLLLMLALMSTTSHTMCCGWTLSTQTASGA
jgi:hypothetical protein